MPAGVLHHAAVDAGLAIPALAAESRWSPSGAEMHSAAGQMLPDLSQLLMYGRPQKYSSFFFGGGAELSLGHARKGQPSAFNGDGYGGGGGYGQGGGGGNGQYNQGGYNQGGYNQYNQQGGSGPQGGYGQGQGGEGEKPEAAKHTLKYKVDDDTYILDNKDLETCKSSCGEQLGPKPEPLGPGRPPQAEEGGAAEEGGYMSTAWGAAKSAGGKVAEEGAEAAAEKKVKDCEAFCDVQNSWLSMLWCFPGSSFVVVRGRGRVPLSQLQVGDAVLVPVRRRGAAAEGADEWEMRFDTVIAWLHKNPDAQGEFLVIKHDLGQIQLTHNHMLFVRRAGQNAMIPIPAVDVRPGDRVLAPWIDGALAMPEVCGVTRVRKRGLYAPLLDGGALMVDGTAASCYAIPDEVRATPIFKQAVQVFDGAMIHALAHAVFRPLRLMSRAALLWQAAGGKPPPAVKALKDDKEPEKWSAFDTTAGIHPYAWVSYVTIASFVI